MDWLIDEWCPLGHRLIDVAPEGGCKTILGSYLAVCIASGTPFLGHDIAPGPVLIVDEETPKPSLENHLDRFSWGIGLSGYRELLITVRHMEGFRFGRKAALNELLDVVRALQPQLVILDSLLAMLPAGRQGLGENNAETGIAVRDDLLHIMDARPGCNTMLAAHSPKPVVDWMVEQLDKAEMQSLVRGHGSVVGEACDTGFALKKLSEIPLRFAIITKARRVAVPMSSKVVYMEMEEESYGIGWARLAEIPPVTDPPSKAAQDLFQLFKGGQEWSAKQIRRENALHTRRENLQALEELKRHRVVLNHNQPLTYQLNPAYQTECDGEYLKKLT